MLNVERIKLAFDLQSGWCAAANSPFMAALMAEIAADLEAGGPCALAFGDWPGDPIADALAMRVAGALQAAALSGRDAALAEQYPWRRADWNVEELWPVAQAFIAHDRDWFVAFLQSPPQTNETRRSIALLPGFLELAPSGPLHTLEIGASAGLLQSWDKFRYQTANWSWGPEGGPFMDAEWRGAPPAGLDAHVEIGSRAGCDQNPLAVEDPEQMLRLRSYIWADQKDRFERLDAAIALARSQHIQIDRADAGVWLTQKLAGELPRGVTVLYHSVVAQYLSGDTRAAARAAIAAAASRATPGRRFAWLQFEPNPVLGREGPVDEMAVQLQVWPDAEKRVIARAHAHGRWVEML